MKLVVVVDGIPVNESFLNIVNVIKCDKFRAGIDQLPISKVRQEVRLHYGHHHVLLDHRSLMMVSMTLSTSESERSG